MLNASAPQRLHGPEDLLGKIPYLLEFHPSESIVTLYLGPEGRVLATSAIAIDAPTQVVVDDQLDAANRSNAAMIAIVGYGPLTASGSVTAVADAMNRHVQVFSTYLVSGGYFYCLNSGCACAAVTGMPFDPKSTTIAAHSTVLGEVALPSRAALLALAAPDPVAQAAVQAALPQARTIHRPELVELDELLERAMLDQRLTTDEVARLALLLRRPQVRNAAWQQTDQLMWQRNLWLDVTRRVPEPYVTAPASLAAWCAWRRGESVLAMAAARRAAAVDPSNTITRVVVGAIQSRIRPTELIPVWPLPPTSPTVGDQR